MNDDYEFLVWVADRESLKTLPQTICANNTGSTSHGLATAVIRCLFAQICFVLLWCLKFVPLNILISTLLLIAGIAVFVLSIAF